MSTETVAVESPEPPRLDALAAALAAFQAEMPTVPKAHTAQVRSDKGSYSYTYAGLADVTEAAMPLLAKHGLSFSTLPGNGVLTGMLLHSSGQHLTASLPIAGSNPQQVGSSLTYMRRYLLGCMTGLVTDDDDDGQAASAPASRKRAAAKPAPAPERAPEPTEPTAISKQQLGLIGALMSKAQITDRAGALRFVADAIGREVESRNDLTKTEASKVIDALKAVLPPDDDADPWAETAAQVAARDEQEAS